MSKPGVYPPLHRGKVPIFYLSGRFDQGGTADKEKAWIQRTGCKTRCWSYVFVNPGAFYYREGVGEAYQLSKKLKCHIVMDSGAFSFQHFLRKGNIGEADAYREKTIAGYVDFVNKDSAKWDFYFNFDYRINAPLVYSVQKKLEKAGIHPTPVFHGDDGMDWLKRYIDEGYKIIGIGGGILRGRWKDKRYYLDQVFNITEKAGVWCHGLALTSLSIAFCYPFYSVDSTTWVRFAAYGSIIIIDPVNHQLQHIHVSTRHCKNGRGSYNNMPRPIQKAIRSQVEAHGFDLDLLRKDLEERAVYNGWVFNHLQELGIQSGGKGKVTWENLW